MVKAANVKKVKKKDAAGRMVKKTPCANINHTTKYKKAQLVFK